MITQVAVIGAGPAGIAAAIQLKRYHIEFILFEANRPGGLLKNAYFVENYPGFPRGVTGPQLASLMSEHLDFYSINPIFQTVEMLEYRESSEKNLPFRLKVSNNVFYAERVVAASGTKPRTLEFLENLLPALKEFVFYEVYPVVGERGKRVLIIGAGDAAFDYALNLSSCNDVVIVNRGERVKALPLLQERVGEAARIRYMENTAVETVDRGVKKALSVLLSNSCGPFVEEFDFVIGAVGREPRRDFYSPQLNEALESLISCKFFFEVGDVSNGRFRQAAIASGSGMRAAMEIAAIISNASLDPDSERGTRSLL